ncbi:unnamed protein product [Adineta steineri]|uniref:Uncharacterized protein n=1 Tax=Adineta steineri TaxID=433720 RepID=A0A819UZ00_9BILA|nr:unnamed protein product [Adineta steineri]CAF4100772.1 unnamed protein product [Adineta steineri]
MASYISSCTTSNEICNDIDNETCRNTNVSLDTIPKSIQQNKNEIDENLQSNTDVCSNNIFLSRNMVTEHITQNINNNHQDTSTNNERVLINIVDINNNITFLWKIRAVVTYEYPKRTFVNTHGTREISNWDLTDSSGSITLVAFNVNSCMMSTKLQKDQAYEFTNLNIRSASDAFKTLPHQYQLVCTYGSSSGVTRI